MNSFQLYEGYWLTMFLTRKLILTTVVNVDQGLAVWAALQQMND